MGYREHEKICLEGAQVVKPVIDSALASGIREFRLGGWIK